MSPYPGNGLVVYQIDESDRIVFVNDAFHQFAIQNAGSPVPNCVGRRLWEFIDTFSVKQVYRLLLQRVRSERIEPRFAFRCDAPELRRFMEMEIRPADDNRVEFRCSLLRKELRAPITLIPTAPAQSHHLTRMCSWCKRIQGPANDWLEVEDSLARLRIFDSDHALDFTHGICEKCYSGVLASMSG